VPDLVSAEVVAGAPTDAVVVQGEVEAASYAEVRIDVPGTVSRIYVERGAYVRKGDLLAELDTFARKERLADARRRFRDARASSIGGVRTGSEPPPWLKAELQRRLVSAEARAASEDYHRRRVVEAALNGDEHAASERALAIAAVRTRSRGSRRIAHRAAEERIAAALVDELGGRVRSLEYDIAHSAVRAPISGQIVSVRLSEGRQWSTRSVDAAFEILDPTSLVVRAPVPVGLADRMRAREVVWLDLGRDPAETVEALVWQIDPQELRLGLGDGSFQTVREVRFTVDPDVARTLDVGQEVRVAVRR
jgi:multidrug efflux pump subunit AcrA (membrane-fusion protein)